MSFTDKLKKFTNDAVEKGKGLAEQGKLALENQKLNEVIKAAKAQIGGYVVENNLLNDDAFVTEQMAQIASAEEAMERNNARITELKTADEAEAAAVPEDQSEAAPARRFCAECGTELAPAAKFCPSCGAKV